MLELHPALHLLDREVERLRGQALAHEGNRLLRGLALVEAGVAGAATARSATIGLARAGQTGGGSPRLALRVVGQAGNRRAVVGLDRQRVRLGIVGLRKPGSVAMTQPRVVDCWLSTVARPIGVAARRCLKSCSALASLIVVS
jgi:hypothetical protein